ncbi:MAG: response regulator [Gammaproteobacteria bacterium]|nr:response regulator [Gammaproteobacteria bacterium]
MYELLAKARILIVDDFSQFRLTLKSMLFKLGIREVDQAVNGAEAIQCCTENDYDIVFCDYNLGDGQDGQQILEELHERRILHKGALFLMVTAETTSARVMGAIEYRPDAYLTKPFTGEQLGQKLQRLVAKNQKLEPIYQAINDGFREQALTLCDEIMQQEPTMRYSCLRLKSELLEQLQQYDEALALYQEVVQEQDLLWAVLGIGRVFFLQDKIEPALTHFQTMQQNFPQQVSVYDWIARCQQALGQMEQAESSLQQAISISPKSVRRQTSLGEIAENLQHHELAHKAYASAIQDGQHSCLLQPQHYQHYYDNTREVAVGLESQEQKRLLAQTDAVCKKMERKYQQHPGALAGNYGALATLFSALGKTDQSSNYISRLGKNLDHPDCHISSEDLAYIDAKLAHLGESGSFETQLQKLTPSMENIRHRTRQDEEDDQSARSINIEGLELAKQQQPLLALDKFRQASNLMPENPNYALNAAQIILTSEELKQDAAHVDEARALLASLALEHSGERWRLYKRLMEYLPDE